MTNQKGQQEWQSAWGVGRRSDVERAAEQKEEGWDHTANTAAFVPEDWDMSQKGLKVQSQGRWW